MSKSNDILVSICCLTYNHGQYIRQCLDGFMMQKTTFPFEVLIHDDASTDRTADIIHEYEAKYPDIIKPIYQKENQYSKGVRISPTFQYPRAKGKYIALCEGDDYWIDPYKLQKQVDFLEDHSEYSMCFHNAMVHWENGQFLDAPFAKLENRDYAGEEIYENWIVPTASVVFRKSSLTSKYEERRKNPAVIFGDIILFLSLAEEGKVHAFKEMMSVYRRQEGGAVYGVNIQRIIRKIGHDKYIGEEFGATYSDVWYGTIATLQLNGFILKDADKASGYIYGVWQNAYERQVENGKGGFVLTQLGTPPAYSFGGFFSRTAVYKQIDVSVTLEPLAETQTLVRLVARFDNAGVPVAEGVFANRFFGLLRKEIFLRKNHGSIYQTYTASTMK